MSQTNLLDIVPDQLFQTHIISDIDQVQKKLQYEIERKREELRAMVGERYRDLIHAADTIEEMKVSTASTLNHIDEMIAACRNLHNTHLVGFKIEEKHRTSQDYQLNVNPVHSLAVQIKLLMEIPEKIWTCIETEDFVKATQLFIMARHVNTGLQLQMGGMPPSAGLQSARRVVQQQWTSVGSLHHTIVRICRERLHDVDITVEVACSCLVSLYLLDSQTLVELLNSLISLQSHSSLQATLQFHLSKILEGDVKAKIKEKVVNGVKIVMKTIVLVYACFVDNDGGAVLAKLKELCHKDSQPVVNLVHFSDPEAVKFLPPVISNYRLTSNKEIEALSNEEIRRCVHEWSSWVGAFVERSVCVLLQDVTRVRVLHEIRERAVHIEPPPNWGVISSCLGLPALHPWRYFAPAVCARARHVVRARWEHAYNTLTGTLLGDLTAAGGVGGDGGEGEADINWFVWKDLIGETVIRTRAEVVTIMNALMKGMSRQDRGYTPALERLCGALEDELGALLDDLAPYTRRAPPEEDEWAQQMYSDREELEQYLRDTSDEHIQNLLQFIKSCFNNPTLQDTETKRKTTAVYTARLTQALPALAPRLRACYLPPPAPHPAPPLPPPPAHGGDSEEKGQKAWNNLCDMLKESCLYSWGKWVDIAVERVTELTAGLPQKFTLEANIDYLMMQWDEIKIEEKDEEGNPVESTIKVPAGPSLQLSQYLYSASRLLDQPVPHTLPQEIHDAYICHVATITLAHYDKVIRENEPDINQRCALQLLMDVRHVTLLLVPRENKNSMEFSQEICELLRRRIDPFDYDVFYPYIQTSLKRSVQRVQTLLGSLVGAGQHATLHGVVGRAAVRSGGCADRAAGLLAAPHDAPWYSLLPVAQPPKQDKPTKKKPISASPARGGTGMAARAGGDISELMSSSLPLNFATARSGAASFFTSMTGDWFGGS